MKRLLLLTILFLFDSQVIAELVRDPKILCLKSQTAYDVSFRASNKSIYYSMNVWLPAAKEEQKKFEARGEKLWDWSVVDEPYKSIRKEHRRLNAISREKRDAYARTLVPILELAGYEKPKFYLWYYTAGMEEVRSKHNIIDLNKVEEFGIGQDYFGHGESGADTRDELCRLYGYEFKDRYGDEEFKRKYKLKDW